MISPVIDAVPSRSMAWEGSLVNAILPDDSTGYSITMAPRIARGKAIVGVAGGDSRRTVDSSSPSTSAPGRELWRFYTVPGDPSKPFENPALAAAAKTWTGEWWKYGGGGSLWDGLSYDPEANLIYVGTGNGAPWPEILRGSEGHDNLYVSSILAVNADTGQLAWHYQAAPGDSWDIDNVQQLILADTTIDGRERKVLMQASKGGFPVLDRLTGEFISATPFAPLNWARGHDPKTGRPLINKEAYYTTTAGGDFTGVGRRRELGTAKAYSPSTRLYVPVRIQQPDAAIPVDPFPAGRSRTTGHREVRSRRVCNRP